MGTTSNRKKGISKKLKSSWRKHININDVEEFLEDQRLDERLGSHLSIVSNDDLFKLDIQPSAELLSAKERRKLRASKPLKCFSALQSRTKVTDPITKRNRVRTKEERRNDLIKRNEFQNNLKGLLKAKEVLARADRELEDIRRKNKSKKGEFNLDIWNAERMFELENDQWITNDTKKHNMRGIGIPIKNVRKSVIEKSSAVPVIEPPHPGTSYNPSFVDHQNLLKIVAEKEQSLIKKEEHLTRCTTRIFQKVSTHQSNQLWLVEMSEGLPSTLGTNVEENEVSDNEYKTTNPPVKNKKKTLKQRKVQKKHQQLEKMRQVIKLDKKKITDIHHLKLVIRHLSKIEKKQNALRQKRLRKAERDKNKTKVLTATKFEEPDLEFNMGEDIRGNLKDLKVEGNLLADRFKSMQKRNILLPTKRSLHKKSKVKRYIKPGHKADDWKKTVAHS